MSLRVATWSWLLTLVFPAALLADPQQCLQNPSIAEVIPRLPTSADQIGIVTLFHTHLCVDIKTSVQDNTIHLVDDPFCFLPPPGCGDFLHFPPVLVGPLPAGSYVISLEGPGGTVYDTQAITVSAPATDLVLQSSRFSVGVTWSYPDGRPGGAAQAVRVTDNSGYFWFFDSGDLEVTVKMLDAALINGRFWLFAASMTDVPFTLTIVDSLGTTGECSTTPAPPACTRTYQSPSGKNQNFIDLDAFPSP